MQPAALVLGAVGVRAPARAVPLLIHHRAAVDLAARVRVRTLAWLGRRFGFGLGAGLGFGLTLTLSRTALTRRPAALPVSRVAVARRVAHRAEAVRLAALPVAVVGVARGPRPPAAAVRLEHHGRPWGARLRVEARRGVEHALATTAPAAAAAAAAAAPAAVISGSLATESGGGG